MNHRLPSFLKNHRNLPIYVLSFVLPLAILTLGIVALHITPFGNHSLAISDGKYHINYELFFARLLRGEENILYSFNNGIGGNEWSNFAWGAFSFGGLLSLFGTLETMPTVFTWVCIVGISLCGPIMLALLSYLRGRDWSNLIFSTSYALIGFNVANCFQMGFHMGPQMLPLVVMGLMKMLRGKSPLHYILPLAFCVFFNFYFAFHLCAISLIFTLGYLYVNGKELGGSGIRGRFLKWLWATCVAGFLAAPMWLPTLKAYSGGGRLDQTGLSEFSFSENMPFIQIFSKLFTGANSLNELVMGLPNIFCGILVVALVIVYFMNREIDARKRRAAGAILAFYLLTFYITAFTLVMHGGTHTNWFPYRYSYVFSFLLIGLAAEEFHYIGTITVSDAKRCGVALLVGVVLVFGTSYEFVSGGMVILDIALILLMWAGLWLYRTKPDKAPMGTLVALLIILVSVNLYANFVISVGKMRDWELDLEEYQSDAFVSGALVDAVKIIDDSFYRIEKDESESFTVGADPYLYDYNGISHSGPAERMFIHRGLNKLGVNWYDMRHWYVEGVPAATDTLLGVKYLISSRDLTAEKGYERKATIDDTSVFFNKNALAIATLVDDATIGIELGSDAFQNLNAAWSSMVGEDDGVFSEVSDITYTLHNPIVGQNVTSEELRESVARSEGERASNDGAKETSNHPTGAYIEYSFVPEKDGSVYLFDTSIPDSVQGLYEPSIKFCGIGKAGQEMTGILSISGVDYVTEEFVRGYCANLTFAQADNSVLERYAGVLNARDTTLDATCENDLKGTFSAEIGERILFTMPWDEGWTCYIDGSEVPIDKTWDLFMSVEAPAGSHSYEMKFVPAWMGIGLILSCMALIVLIIGLLILIRGRNTNELSSPAVDELSMGIERDATNE